MVTIEKTDDWLCYIRLDNKVIGTYNSRDKKILMLWSTHIDVMARILEAINLT